MKIAFYGSSLVSAYWNGAATYYRGIIRNLHELGYRVTFFEPDAYSRQQNRDLKDDPDYARVVVYPGEGHEGVERVLDEAAEYDIVVKASGVGVFDELLEAEVIARRKPHQTLIFWDVDAPATLDRMRRNADDAFRALVPQYDLVFTYGGGDPVVREYGRVGARSCVPIYNALDPRTHHPVARRAEFDCDLSFLGNRLPDREARVADFFLGAARRLPERAFLLGGAGWRADDVPGNVRIAGHVGSGAHNAFYCSGLATLNVNRGSMARYGFSPPTRIFEAAGAGACIITDAWEGIECFLEPGEEILVAADGGDVAETLRALTPQVARRIGQAAKARVRARHTYAHRAREVIELLDAPRPESEAAE
jgi:spore maturation protein CgeB